MKCFRWKDFPMSDRLTELEIKLSLQEDLLEFLRHERHGAPEGELPRERRNEEDHGAAGHQVMRRTALRDQEAQRLLVSQRTVRLVHITLEQSFHLGKRPAIPDRKSVV